MRPEKQHLLRDLLGEANADPHREATLLAGRRILRHRRHRRMAIRTCAFVLLAALIFTEMVTLSRHPKRTTIVLAKSPPPPSAAETKVHFLTDDELLDLFPNTPVVLATVNHKKRLFFPRAGDEEKFMNSNQEAPSGE